MKKPFVLAWAILMLAMACLVSEKATATHKPSAPASSQSGRQDAPRTYKVKLGNGKDKRVQLSMFNSNVKIVGHTGDEVIIETRDYIAPPKRAEGLKPLYNQVEDNTNLGLSVTKNNNTLTIAKASRASGEYLIRIPRNAAVVYKETNWEGGDLSISDVDGEVELKLNNSEATLTNVSGPVVANNTNGSIKVVFSSLDQSKPSAISTVSGDIDITLPAKDKANFKLKSLQGEIYTDFDLEMQRSKNDDEGLALVGGGGDIAGKVNGGGVEISVQSITSDIFIRKKK
ncbi:DUF4097 family beta strand repeat-containing protein [Rufibacter sp. XAAS-G3-1]|uniref:DUF4097 family beta strand repeat-containing protein n=1 Tax=Rufibacter sp. XAAS-G3-1 TaxID=2729134 RepID=UPI0021046FF5|nr:DUF4097 family beta strand repeat-containing protein [Rufibacter sp. XAAS-G3-1]